MSTPKFSLESELALVTGGSRGTGRAIALAFAEAGADVVVSSRKLPDLEKISHVQDKLAWLTMYAEGTGALGKVACEHCVTEPGSDLLYLNPTYSNIAKFFFVDTYHQAVKYVLDIAGGSVATIPSFRDFSNPETRPYMEEYFGAKLGVPPEHRVRAFKLVKDLAATLHAVNTIHAEGSMAAQRLSIYSLTDFERDTTAARRVARISDGKEHPLFAELPEFPPGISQSDCS